ncbi:MAG: hypothetical protein ACYDAP_05725 [Thermoplasmataceae archaeon]
MTARNIDRDSPYKMIANSSKAQKIQELSDILDEIFSLKAKLKKTGDAENAGKR